MVLVVTNKTPDLAFPYARSGVLFVGHYKADRSPPCISDLLEVGHDLIDCFEESALWILTRWDEITTHLSVLVEGHQFPSIICVDQFRSVACTTGSRSGSSDIRRDFADGSVCGGDHCGRREDASQRLVLSRHIVSAFNVARLAVRVSMGRIGEPDVMLILHGLHRIGEIDIADIERLEGMDRMDIGVERPRLHFQMGATALRDVTHSADYEIPASIRLVEGC